MPKKAVSKHNLFSSRRKKPRKKKKVQKLGPLWELQKDGITNSALQSWVECREQFARRYIDGWTSKGLSVPLTFGSLWHLAHEFSATKTPWKGVDQYVSRSRLHISPLAKKSLDQIEGQVRALYPAYTLHYGPVAADYEFIAHESLFRVDKLVDGVTVPLRGKRDADYRKAGKLGLWEIKTKSQINKELISDLLRCDFQTLLYLWAMREEYGECPGWITYDVIKRPSIRQKKTESLKDYLNRVYDTAVEAPSQYFCRWEVEVFNEDIDQFDERILTPTLQAFVKWNAGVSQDPLLPGRLNAPLHYQSLPALVNAYGKADLYDLIVNGKTKNYYRRSYPHPELDDPNE